MLLIFCIGDEPKSGLARDLGDCLQSRNVPFGTSGDLVCDTGSEQGGDFSQEIAVYEAAIQAQTELLKELGTKEIGAMEQLAQLLG